MVIEGVEPLESQTSRSLTGDPAAFVAAGRHVVQGHTNTRGASRIPARKEQGRIGLVGRTPRNHTLGARARGIGPDRPRLPQVPIVKSAHSLRAGCSLRQTTDLHICERTGESQVGVDQLPWEGLDGDRITATRTSTRLTSCWASR